jgi:hypothetical protein
LPIDHLGESTSISVRLDYAASVIPSKIVWHRSLPFSTFWRKIQR